MITLPLEELRLERLPELSKYKFEKDGVEYKVTDFTYLNPLAWQALDYMVGVLAVDKDTEEIGVCFEEDETRKIIGDILLGFTVEVRRGGKNGWFACYHPVEGVEYTDDITSSHAWFKLNRDFAEAVHELFKEGSNKQVSIQELAVQIARHGNERYDQIRRRWTNRRKR